jgi:PiT family inorganic phosphate transporter
VAGSALGGLSGVATVGVAIGIGGALGARRVAETVSHRISVIAPGQGLVANAVTALLVTIATPAGLPVSTTHVATGSIVGIGLANGTARWPMIGKILLAWVTTLPLAALLASLTCAVLARVSSSTLNV